MHRRNPQLTYLEFQELVNPWRMPSAFTNNSDDNQLFTLEIQATAVNSVAKYSSDENNIENANNKNNAAVNMMDVYDIANAKEIFPQGTRTSLISTSSSSSSPPSCIPVITTAAATSENVFKNSNANDVINSVMTDIANIELNPNDLTTAASSNNAAVTNIAHDENLSNSNNNSEITKLGYNNDTTTTTIVKEKAAATAPTSSNNNNVPCEQGNNPLKQIIVTIEHKIRNLEKRKTKLESYRDIQASGKDLSNDQKLAVAKFDAVASTLDFARSLSKQIVQISKEAEKEQKKQARKELVAKAQAETAKIREVLILQNIIARFKEESVHEAFRNGSYGAIKLEPNDLNALDKFIADVNLDSQETDNDISQNAQKCAEFYSMTIDGRPKQYHQNVTYEKIHELFEKIQKCGFLEKAQKRKQQKAHADVKSEQNMQHGEQKQQHQQQHHQLIEQQQEITPQAPPAAVLPVFQGQNIPSSISPLYNPTTGLVYAGNENTMQSPDDGNAGAGITMQPASQPQPTSMLDGESHQFSGQTQTNVCNVEQAFFKQHRQFMQQMRPLAEVIGNGNFYFLQDSEVDSPEMGMTVCGGNNMQNNMATSPLSAIFIEQQNADNVVQQPQQQQSQSLITTQTFTNQSFPQIPPHNPVANKSPTAAVELQQHALFSPVSSVNSQKSVTSTKSQKQHKQQQQQASLPKDMQATIVGANNNVINVAGNKSKSPKLSNAHVMGVMHANDVATGVGVGAGVPAIVTPSNVVYAFDSTTLYRPQLEQQQQQHQMMKTSKTTDKPLIMKDKLEKNNEIIAALSKKEVGEPTVPVNAWNSPLNSTLNLSSNLKTSTAAAAANSLGVVDANRNNNKNTEWSNNNSSNNEWSGAVTATTPTAASAAATVTNNSNNSTSGAFGDNTDANHWNSNATVNTSQQQSQIDNMNVVTVGNYGRGNGRSGSNHRRNDRDERNQRNGGNSGYRNRNNNYANSNGGGGGAMGDGVNNNNSNNNTNTNNSGGGGGGNRNNASGVFFRNNENSIGMAGNASTSSYFQNGTNNTNIYGGNAIKETTSRFHNDYRSSSRSGGANNSGARTSNNSNNNSATRSLLRGAGNNNNNNNNNNSNNNNTANTSSGTGTTGANTYIPARPYRIP